VPNQFKSIQIDRKTIAVAPPPEVDEASPSVSGVTFTENLKFILLLLKIFTTNQTALNSA
jgi:hypothetical protein